MQRRTVLAAAGSVVALGGGYVGYELFAPEQATAKSEDQVNDGGATVLKSGSFTGKAGHECTGRVELASDDGHFLQFREFQMTQGPDVYCYATPAADPDAANQVRAGTKVRMDGGADGGELTLTGTFAQDLPDGVDPAKVNGVSAWCEDFSVPFGAATLE